MEKQLRMELLILLALWNRMKISQQLYRNTTKISFYASNIQSPQAPAEEDALFRKISSSHQESLTPQKGKAQKQ